LATALGVACNVDAGEQKRVFQMRQVPFVAASGIRGMKLLENFSDICYRMLTPMWAHSPTNGAGAARCGGRANRPGIDGLFVN
jgi:hypothetical protein